MAYCLKIADIYQKNYPKVKIWNTYNLPNTLRMPLKIVSAFPVFFPLGIISDFITQ